MEEREKEEQEGGETEENGMEKDEKKDENGMEKDEKKENGQGCMKCNGSVNRPTSPRSDEVLVINVAGLKFRTRRSTLQKFPDTLLGSKEIEEYYVKERKEYFFDRCRSTFETILYYYQSPGIVCLPSSVNPDVFVEELRFFKIEKRIVDKFNAVDTLTGNDQVAGEYVCPLQQKTWLLFDDPNSSKVAKVIGYLDQIVILLAVAAQCIESLPLLRNESLVDEIIFNSYRVKDASEALVMVEYASITWFTIIFIVRAVSCPDKIAFCKSILNWLDVLAVLPFYLQLLLLPTKPYLTVLRFFRTMRIVRIFKISRYFEGLFALGRALSASAGELLLLCIMLATFVVLFSSLIYFTDSCDVNECLDDGEECVVNVCEEGPNQFDSVVAGFWWSLVTMSTVGYGDYVPKTPLGKVVGGMCALTGILVISLPFPLIITNFNKFMRSRATKSKVYATIADGYSVEVPYHIPEYTGVAYGFELTDKTQKQKNFYKKIEQDETTAV